MSDLPRKSDGLIVMGDLPKEKWWWSHYDGWPTQRKMFSLWWVTYPNERWWSHYDGWPTQMQDGLIMTGDLPICKMMVSLWWVTYPNRRWWSYYDGWPTQMQDGLIMTGDLPICKMMVLFWWVTYPHGRWWSHFDGWPTHMEDERWSHDNRRPTQMIKCYLSGRKTWLEKSLQDKADKLGASWLQGWLEDSSWW
jgi:hypothetical protein